ncbi:MAG: septal ring lytic transglycosylase RlpA family protein [Lactobacillales bacterium]|jgi:rare lipoprotein A|nr:septal ring lytic transglycosylase RlpA family protein [Lactobacillales bacterium]
MIKVLKKALFFIPFFIFGCTDNGFLFRSTGKYDKTDTGVYMVGHPYQIKGIWYYPEEDYSYTAKGSAAWFDADENHAVTANGEKYDEEMLTARHRTLPLPSIVRITNLENGNTAIVRVNDRGPYVHNRLIDVSRQTAAALEFQSRGTTLVQVDILAQESKQLKKELLAAKKVDESPAPETSPPIIKEQKPGNTPIYQPDEVLITPLYEPKDETAPPAAATPQNGPEYYVQIGAFGVRENAEKVKENLRSETNIVLIDKTADGKTLTLVRAGPYKSSAEAGQWLDKIQTFGYGDLKVLSQ